MSENKQKTLGEFLTWAESKFIQANCYFGHGTDNAWDEAVALAIYVLDLPLDIGIEALKIPITADQEQQLTFMATIRAEQRLPLPYITNQAWYAGNKFIVNQQVLIPRSPLFEVIHNQFKPWLSTPPARILDLCTGSGALAIICSKTFANCQVDAVDISQEALAVAEKNIEQHQCQSTVHLKQSDLFTSLPAQQQYNVIISNPPYVGQQELKELPKEYTYEPQLALASGEHGLDCCVKILQQASDYLAPGGILIIELGNSWQELQQHYLQVAFTWLEFAYGGEGVCLLTKEELDKYGHHLTNSA